MQSFDGVIIEQGNNDEGKKGKPSFSSPGVQRSPRTASPSKMEEDSDSDNEDQQGENKAARSEMEAVQEARQLEQLKAVWRWLKRALTVIFVAGTLFLAIRPGLMGIRIGGAAPWRWATMASVFLGSKSLFNWILNLVMMALDRKHVVAKRVSFILSGIFDNLVFTLYYIGLRMSWGALLRDAAIGPGDWGPTHLLVRRICSSLIAWGVIHTLSRGIARYMEVYFQREAFFNPIMKALAEEFVVVTLLSICSLDMRQWQADHDMVQAATLTPTAKALKTRSSWAHVGQNIKKVPGLYSAFLHMKTVKHVIEEGPLSLATFLRLAKDTLPIKTDMIMLKEGAIQPTDLSLARMYKVSRGFTL
jgi:hypothetical protein